MAKSARPARVRQQPPEVRIWTLTGRKISGRLRSETTTRHRYAIRDYGSTAAKHGHHVFTAIRDALARNPLDPAPPRPPELHLKSITQRSSPVTQPKT